MCNIMTIQMVLWLPVPFALLFLHVTNTFPQVMTDTFVWLVISICDFRTNKSIFFLLKRREYPTVNCTRRMNDNHPSTAVDNTIYSDQRCFPLALGFGTVRCLSPASWHQRRQTSVQHQPYSTHNTGLHGGQAFVKGREEILFARTKCQSEVYLFTLGESCTCFYNVVLLHKSPSQNYYFFILCSDETLLSTSSIVFLQ